MTGGRDAVIELAPIGIAKLDLDGRPLWVNPRLCQLLGHEREDLLSGTLQEVVFREDTDAGRELIHRVARGEIPDHREQKRFLRPDASTTWIRLSLTPVRDEGGEPVALVCFVEDLGSDTPEARRKEEALGPHTRRPQENESRLRALVEASPLGIDIMDLEGNPVFHNPKAEELHGMPFNYEEGRGWEDAVHPEDRERIATSWYAAARKGESWAETYRFRHADGRVVWVSGRAAPIRVEGEMVGFVGTLEDVTPLKLAEEEAERTARRRDDVMAFVAHDIRNPVHTINTVASLLIRAPVSDEERVRHLRVIQRSATVIDSLIQDLLDVALIESDVLDIERQPVDLRALVESTLETFEGLAREAGVTLASEIAPDPCIVRGDPARLVQLLSNLVGNAIKFTPKGGRVDVRAFGSDGTSEEVVVTVEDTGIGIAPDQVPRIFERFWQSGSKGRAGSGLGLAISKAIADAHGSDIEVESVLGHGSVFRFVLPAATSREVRRA